MSSHTSAPSDRRGAGRSVLRGPRSDWVRGFFSDVESEARVLCFPHAGGAASTYRPLAQLLAPRIAVWAVQYPGRQDRRTEPVLDSITAISDRVVTSLAQLPDTDDDRPLALFGHSMGALVAFEVARRLEAAGPRRPVRVFVSGRRAPSLPSTQPSLHDKGDAALLAELRRLNGTAEEILADEEQVRLFLPALRGDYKAVETYRPTGPAVLSCPITVFTGEQDAHVTPGGAARWAAHTTAECDMRTFPGGHFFVDTQRPQVASAITSRLLS
ncbi:thioesterase II family protein [Streptomyces luteolus]|uniref:Alpha/beta fold hydrolase n=1 Tax=Streptomyces luteolus TaxID=3043615 RepID=A0ABT6T7Q2_9ACTN|nr:alpha/beta fold hydrolase [Streptomyces sp. B-S-A12]MDI3423854.1 alpha/beta fold hydrolase [Streptomyces sp. B-S-A12]